MLAEITFPHEQIQAFCREHHIESLRVFGSALRADFRPDSDVDLLVRFEPGHVPGYITFSTLRLALSELLGRSVDLRTADSLSDYFRAAVEAEAVPIYEHE